MANPRAEFVLTARDATAAAFVSADRNMKQLQRTAMGMRRVLASFGVVLSARAFAGWVQGALDAKNMTEQQRQSTEEARKAVASMKMASDELARSFAVSLAPAIDMVANALVGLNAGLFGADPFPLEKQANQLRDTLTALRAQLGSSGGMPTAFLDDLRRKIQETEAALEALHRRQLDTVMPQGQRSQLITDDEINAINNLIAEINTPAARKPLITQDELVALESFIYELNQVKKEPFITQDEMVALEEFLYELNQKPPMLTQDEWVDLEEFLYELNNGSEAIERMQAEAESLREALGRGLRDSFVDFLVDGEARFKDFVRRMVAELAVSGIFTALSGGLAGSTNPIGKFFGKVFGGARAEGGPVSSGEAYLVGERGPELFMPKASGAIVPNGAGQHVHIEQHLHFDVGLESVDERIRGAAGPISAATAAAVLKIISRPSMA